MAAMPWRSVTFLKRLSVYCLRWIDDMSVFFLSLLSYLVGVTSNLNMYLTRTDRDRCLPRFASPESRLTKFPVVPSRPQLCRRIRTGGRLPGYTLLLDATATIAHVFLGKDHSREEGVYRS